MAAEPPTATRNRSFSDSYSSNDFRSTPLNPMQMQMQQLSSSTSFASSSCSADASRRRVLDNAPIHFATMVNEIERVRSRFTSEKSNTDQFASQLRMLSQQIESLTTQQASMLDFHIGRMDSMLKDLQSSGDVAKQQQRVAFEAEQRAKFEQDQRERLQHEERERVERERREMMEKLEREHRERTEREHNEREERSKREAIEREHREKMNSLQRGSMPSMNLSDIIPQPSRTVTASKRKLSLDLGAGGSQASHQEGAKRAKTDGTNTESLDGMFRQFVKSENEKQTNQDSAVTSSADDSSAPMEDDELPVEDGAPAAVSSEADLPTDIQEALKQQAMAMLQAQLDVAGTAVKPEPNAAPPQSFATPATSSALPPASSSSVVKSETPKPAAATTPPVKSVSGASGPPKSSAKKSKSASSKKPKKEVIPAVEDTTIADPMSVPLKNKAIHEWMSKDPERLYTADDICNAGIRYRVRCSTPARGLFKGKVYVLNGSNFVDVRNVLKHKDNTKRFQFVKGGSESTGGWKVMQ